MDNPGKISILVPVYKEGFYLGKLLEQLSESNLWEVIVVIDSPSRETLEILEKYRKKIKYLISDSRLGKARSLNRALKYANGEILVFIDADHYLENTKQLEDFVRQYDGKHEIIEFKKVVDKENLLSKLVYYDYVGFAIVNWLSAKLTSKCIGINGSAFAIKRYLLEDLGGFPENEISEDLGLAFKAYMRGAKFKFEEKVVFRLKAPTSWREWFKQRWRWGHGFALWLKHNYIKLLQFMIKDPKIVFMPAFFFYPSLIAFLITIFLPENRFIAGLFLLFFLISSRIRLFIPILFAAYFSITFVRGVVVSVISFIFSSLIFYLFARRLGYNFNPLIYIIYFYFYSPLWFLIILISVIRVFLLRKIDIKDWPIRNSML